VSALRGIGVVKSVIALCIVMMLVLAIMMPPLPERVIIWWDEGQCWWFDGTIEDKWIEEGDGNALTKDYLFLVNGTLSDLDEDGITPMFGNNTTRISMVMHGDAWDYDWFEVGMYYEGYACDTVPLREAVISGTLEILIWATDS